MKLLKRFFCLFIIHQSPERKAFKEFKARIYANIEKDKVRQKQHKRMTGSIENKILMTKAIKREL